ncbi:hypothetical protein SDC9_204550 [bioreactor metagenome]|uniref:Uncharacterized protein n=1 Tax=bioreactor metagenome TaxID=1076179 RepID=A0A645J0C5_9ZZZZ
MFPEFEPEPLHVRNDRFDVFGLFLGRIGIVEAEVAAPVVLRRDAEVQADRLGVADMQVAVRFGGEAGDDFSAVFVVAEIFRDDFADEIQRAVVVRNFRHIHKLRK